MKAIPINEHHHTRGELEQIACNCKDEHWSRGIKRPYHGHVLVYPVRVCLDPS